jgi:cytochrome b
VGRVIPTFPLFVAATDGSTVVFTAGAAVLAALVAAIAGIIGYALKARADKHIADNSLTLGFIQQSQSSQSAALAQQHVEIVDLRAQVAALRIEVADALNRYEESESARLRHLAEIAELKRQLAQAQARKDGR